MEGSESETLVLLRVAGYTYLHGGPQIFQGTGRDECDGHHPLPVSVIAAAGLATHRSAPAEVRIAEEAEGCRRQGGRRKRRNGRKRCARNKNNLCGMPAGSDVLTWCAIL